MRRLCAEDQADRTPPQGKAMDWAVVGPRDRARLRRVKELYAQDRLRTADDYDCAATVFMHGEAPEDSPLAHELWVVAVARGRTTPTRSRRPRGGTDGPRRAMTGHTMAEIKARVAEMNRK